jgi:hypothetical protein
MSNQAPNSAKCNKAIKILEQFERLAKKLGIKISHVRLQHLNDLRNNGTITSSDLPAKLAAEMPGEFANMPLAEIQERCGKS